MKMKRLILAAAAAAMLSGCGDGETKVKLPPTYGPDGPKITIYGHEYFFEDPGHQIITRVTPQGVIVRLDRETLAPILPERSPEFEDRARSQYIESQSKYLMELNRRRQHGK